MRLAADADVLGLANRMCASSGVPVSVGSAANDGSSCSAFLPSGAPLSLCRPMIASCSANGVRSQNSTNMRMRRTA